MKEALIQSILNAMQQNLDCKQMILLKAILTEQLENFKIEEVKDLEGKPQAENSTLLETFLSAKKVEGCSEKTLAYYQSTIAHFLTSIDSFLTRIDTECIRKYLFDYQEQHKSSKVTIDNMRRILSSFFAWLEDEDYIAKSPVRRIHKVKSFRQGE